MSFISREINNKACRNRGTAVSLKSSPTGVEEMQQSLSNSLNSPGRIAMPHHFFPGFGI